MQVKQQRLRAGLGQQTNLTEELLALREVRRSTKADSRSVVTNQHLKELLAPSRGWERHQG
jgi:hypothetical protein